MKVLFCEEGVWLDTVAFDRYNIRTWQRSSVVEQGTHKPLVTSSNLVAATFLLATYVYYFIVAVDNMFTF